VKVDWSMAVCDSMVTLSRTAMSSFKSHIAIIRRIWPLLPVFVALPVLAQIDSRELQGPPAEVPRPIVQLRSLSTNDRTELTETDWKQRRASLRKQWQSFLGKVPRKRTSMKGRVLESEGCLSSHASMWNIR
jgi:hypothetical protein